MRISTFFYTIKQGLKNIWKNKMFSLASIATMYLFIRSVLYDRDKFPVNGEGCGVRRCRNGLF